MRLRQVPGVANPVERLVLVGHLRSALLALNRLVRGPTMRTHLPTSPGELSDAHRPWRSPAEVHRARGEPSKCAGLTA
eukprot:37461-Alexandrium_andersonii.AAC.1